MIKGPSADRLSDRKASFNKIIEAESGSDYALEAVYELGQLNYESFPVNSTGKVMKQDLKEAVVSLRENVGQRGGG